MSLRGTELTKLVGVTADTSQLLGFVVLYGVPQTLVDAKEFTKTCVDLGIPAPRPIEGVDAFKRATRRAEAKREPISGEKDRYYNLMVREVPSTDSRTFRELWREVVDEKGTRVDETSLSFRPLVKWCYSRSQNSLSAHILEMETMEPDVLLLAQEAIDSVRMAFETEINCYSGNVVRDTIRNYIEAASAIPIKENGGAAYFIPRLTLKKGPNGKPVMEDDGKGGKQPVQIDTGHAVVEAMNRLVIRLNELRFRLDWWDLPVVDGDKERGRVMGAVEERLRLQSVALMEKIKAEQERVQNQREKTGNPDLDIPPSVVRRYQDELAEILRVRQDMESLLERTIDSIQGAVELAQAKVESLMW